MRERELGVSRSNKIKTMIKKYVFGVVFIAYQ